MVRLCFLYSHPSGTQRLCPPPCLYPSLLCSVPVGSGAPWMSWAWPAWGQSVILVFLALGSSARDTELQMSIPQTDRGQKSLPSTWSTHQAKFPAFQYYCPITQTSGNVLVILVQLSWEQGIGLSSIVDLAEPDIGVYFGKVSRLPFRSLHEIMSCRLQKSSLYLA